MWFLLLCLVPQLYACSKPSLAHAVARQKAGELVQLKDTYGQFYAYIPAQPPADPEVLVVIHGTPQSWDSAEFTAHYYAEIWFPFAEKHGLILIVPAFTQQDFSSRYGDRALTGYRALFGREICADEWIIQLVETYQGEYSIPGSPFYLYGHSAGGQFTARFLLTHPDRIIKAVISSAATYPQPDPLIAWPYGMGSLNTEIKWDDGSLTSVDVKPDEETWLAATQVPLIVIVGLGDTAKLPQFPGQKGFDRYTIASNWVQDMCDFAEQRGQSCAFEFVMIPGKGHSMSGLAGYAQSSFFP